LEAKGEAELARTWRHIEDSMKIMRGPHKGSRCGMARDRGEPERERPSSRIEAGAAAAPRRSVDQNPSEPAWARANGSAIFKASLSVTGVKPWFRIVRQPKISSRRSRTRTSR